MKTPMLVCEDRHRFFITPKNKKASNKRMQNWKQNRLVLSKKYKKVLELRIIFSILCAIFKHFL